MLHKSKENLEENVTLSTVLVPIPAEPREMTLVDPVHIFFNHGSRPPSKTEGYILRVTKLKNGEVIFHVRIAGMRRDDPSLDIQLNDILNPVRLLQQSPLPVQKNKNTIFSRLAALFQHSDDGKEYKK